MCVMCVDQNLGRSTVAGCREGLQDGQLPSVLELPFAGLGKFQGEGGLGADSTSLVLCLLEVREGARLHAAPSPRPLAFLFSVTYSFTSQLLIHLLCIHSLHSLIPLLIYPFIHHSFIMHSFPTFTEQNLFIYSFIHLRQGLMYLTGWLQTLYVDEDAHELLILLSPAPWCCDCRYDHHYFMLGLEFRAAWTLSRSPSS